MNDFLKLPEASNKKTVMKVKILDHDNIGVLETQINEFLEKTKLNRWEVVRILQSSVSHGGYLNMQVSIWYECVGEATN